MKKRKNIYVLATGGTIAGEGKNNLISEYQSAKLNIFELLKTIPDVSHLAQISGEQILNIDSNDMTINDLILLAQKINKLSQTDIDAFVITHGTDTLEETAFFLNMVINTNKPIIITGAMRPSNAISADGPLNLYQAIVLASSDKAIGQGVLVVFSEGIYSGRDVQKINTFKSDAFDEKDFACLGYVRDDNCYFYKSVIKTHTINSIFKINDIDKLPCVNVVYFCVDCDISILDYFAQVSQGIVIAGTGSGNYSKNWYAKIQQFADMGIPVVRSSRISAGIITKNAYIDISDNIIPSNTLSPQKARILLALCLTKTNNYEEIKDVFDKY